MRGADDRGNDRRWDDPGSAGSGGAGGRGEGWSADFDHGEPADVPRDAGRDPSSFGPQFGSGAESGPSTDWRRGFGTADADEGRSRGGAISIGGIVTSVISLVVLGYVVITFFGILGTSGGVGGVPSVFILVFGVFVVTTVVKIVRSILRSFRR